MSVRVLLFTIAAFAALSQVANARNGCEPAWFFDGTSCRPMFYERYALPYEESRHHGWYVRAGPKTSGEQGIWIQPWKGECPRGFSIDPKVNVCVDRRW